MRPTDEQQAVIDAPAAPGTTTLVIAGAGSGKTTTLIERLAKDATYFNPAEMVVITFTQKAAQQLKDRLLARRLRLGFIGTLHAWAMHHVRTAGQHLGYTETAAIIGEDQATAMIRATAARLAIPRSVNVSDIRASLLDPFKRCDKRKPAGLAAAAFLQECRRANALTFDTVLTEFLDLIEAGRTPSVQALYVDEYQDTAPIDDAIYRGLQRAIPTLSFFAVGDADQAIYGFRGAEIENILSLARDADLTFTLAYNFRSSPAIVHAANRLIRRNKQRLPKDMRAANATWKASIDLKPCATRAQEAEEIRDWLHANRKQTTAILTRYNDDADFFSDYLQSHGLQVARRKIDEHAKARALAVSALNALIGPSAAAGFWATHYATKRPHLKAAAAKQGRPLAEVCLEHAKPCKDLQSNISDLDLGQTERWLINQAWTGDPGETILALESAAEQTPTEASGIYVGTIHSAKGLEWDAVAVAGLEQQTIPKTAERAEEERRLFYVAITRARHALHLSYATRDTEGKATTQSQFIHEAL
jgi:DNA helicase-2/ATP-dependent DNA helicase PcrA